MGLCALFTAAVRGIMRRETDELVSPPFNGWRDVQEQVADAENKKNKNGTQYINIKHNRCDAAFYNANNPPC